MNESDGSTMMLTNTQINAILYKHSCIAILYYNYMICTQLTLTVNVIHTCACTSCTACACMHLHVQCTFACSIINTNASF